MLGPFATASRRTRIHQVSLLSHARIDVHDNDDDNDNARQRGPLWPHRMGPIIYAEIISTAVFSARLARDVIYTSRAYATMSVCPSVRL